MVDLGNTEVAKMSKGPGTTGVVPTGARYTSMGVEFGSPDTTWSTSVIPALREAETGGSPRLNDQPAWPGHRA